MAVLGLFFGWKLIIMIALISFVIGAVVSLILIAAKVKSRKDFIPFGPFISIAALLVIFYGTQIIQFYFRSILI
jgi:leader peptidase (prepilin peptidase)/N-methyltransferase